MFADVKIAEKFIIMPYRKAKGKLSGAEMRPVSSEAGAIKIATSMAERYTGVAAYAMLVDRCGTGFCIIFAYFDRAMMSRKTSLLN